MSNVTNIAPTGERPDPAELLEKVVVTGDLSKLTPKERLSYYKAVCESVGLNPLTRPFDYIVLNGRLTLYARKDATDQLRRIHGISITITSRELLKEAGLYVVTARARTKDGREDESIGAVSIVGLKGDALANALMKAETKAKRRVTLSIAGLGMLDESEIETIPDARPVKADEAEAPPVRVVEPGTPSVPSDAPDGGDAVEGTYTVVRKDEGTTAKGTPYVRLFLAGEDGEAIVAYAKEDFLAWAKELTEKARVRVGLKKIGSGSAYEIIAVGDTVATA
ncbi:MAG: hypothetical protein HSCHL_1630 [Hydrogenibacillus schlegelii]|uniref:Uncharacterized protein n=1 Tax=Hydrogenibacillus schlegelii TaxID=1484 RepID=A0A2T5G4B3_HYDSH|nr:hypothetical protein [Hydrogenibacillus schlegelii]PTQ51040.1 MAG: hypothetical protein HSCHL_1630 [Hydrogenibacillus schlegelii]